MSNKIRLNKFISTAGYASRRKADQLISDGKVKVNGEIADLGTVIDPQIDQVQIDDQVLSNQPLVYYALYKPKDIISSAKDESGRQTVVDLIQSNERLYPIGRLDKESEGLMILTNDGELTQKLTHPSFEHEKEYVIECRSQNSKIKLTDQNAKLVKRNFIEGISIDGKLMRADRIDIRKLNTDFWELNIVLHTGYNRQIRKMCDKMELKVVKLIRTRIGKLTLRSLGLLPGEYKIISRNQII